MTLTMRGRADGKDDMAGHPITYHLNPEAPKQQRGIMRPKPVDKKSILRELKSLYPPSEPSALTKWLRNQNRKGQ